MKTGGHLLHFKYRKKQKRLPKYLLLLDVSQSMDVYAKVFLRFTRQLLAVFDQSEAFAFNTHLMYLGKGFGRLSESEFEDRINSQSDSWLGGTRIAASLRAFNEEHLRESVNSKTTVVIFSDGCDTAESDELIAELAPLKRRCAKLIWVNPLLGRYAPGEADLNMDPLRPLIDVYRSSHNLESLALLEKDLLSV